MAEMITLLCIIAFYCFICYAIFRIGRKFNPDATFPPHLIPVYNGVLLCRYAGMSGWFVLLVFIPYVGVIFPVVVYGKIAKRLGHNFWLYGLLSLVASLSLFILAFNSSMPVGEGEAPVWQQVAPREQDA